MSPSTKIVVPMELGGLLNGLKGLLPTDAASPSVPPAPAPPAQMGPAVVIPPTASNTATNGVSNEATNGSTPSPD
jgi:hypothetical protein